MTIFFTLEELYSTNLSPARDVENHILYRFLRRRNSQEFLSSHPKVQKSYYTEFGTAKKLNNFLQ